MTEFPKDLERPPPSWAVLRQDDNGNRFLVETGLSREEAERLVAQYETTSCITRRKSLWRTNV
jgi:hypothetical protein